MLILFILLGFNLIVGQKPTAPSFGSSTKLDPYQIATLDNLYWIKALNNVVPSPTIATKYAAYYIQTANIDNLNLPWTTIGTNGLFQFTGSYKGQGYKILNIFIYGWRTHWEKQGFKNTQ